LWLSGAHNLLPQDTHSHKLRTGCRMRILDTRWLGRHGIGRFAAELRARLSGFEPIHLKGRPSSAVDPWRLHLYLRSVTADLFFSPGYNAPVHATCAFAFCLHDLNHLHVQENSGPLKRAYYEHLIKPAVRRAAVVLTVSEFSRAAICEWAGIAEASVINVGNGVSAPFAAEGPRVEMDRPYFLYVGNHRPHKNFERLLRAFAISGLDQDCLLVSTGTPSRELRSFVAALGLGGCVRFVGSVSDEALASLYRGATGLVLVSLYEGFGLPIVEAMSCGAAVLTSTTASMPETAGGAALLVDPTSVDAIAAGLRQIASDERLRQSLRHRGFTRSREFSWERTASRVQLALAGLVDSSKERACAWH
jgi:glycosyltransferase involved in cell wall biosynthesis